MSCRGSSALRWSFRLMSRRLRQEATRRTASTSSSVLFRQSVPPTSSSSMNVGSLGIVQARFSSSDNKCTEHKVEDCNKCSKDVSFDELTSLMKDAGSLRLVDVRESYELREAGRIPHAVNIPLTQLKGVLALESELFQEKTGLQKPTKADSIVFYGMGSIRSVAALEIACKMGYKKARHYPGGWQEWSKMQGDRV